MDLVRVSTSIVTCTDCALHRQCRSPVPLTAPQSPRAGNSRVSQCGVLGEAPGRREDKLGRPFVGQSGKLLRRMLEDAGWDSEGLWYWNSVSCWPHRTPLPAEQNACWGNMLDQMRVSGCKYIIAAGGVALNALVKNAEGQFLRGSVFMVPWLPGAPYVMPIWHPAYILKNAYLQYEVEEQLHSFRRMAEGVIPPEFLTGDKCAWCGDQTMMIVTSIPCCRGCKPQLNSNKKRMEKYRTWQNKRKQLSLTLDAEA